MKQLSRIAFIILLLLEAFHALSALSGGFGLMSDPTAESLGMQIQWLNGTPFGNYFWPGLVLFSVNGLGNTAGFVCSLRKKCASPLLGAVLGVIMMGWIAVQVSLIGYKSFLQPLYFTTGVFQACCAGVILLTHKHKK